MIRLFLSNVNKLVEYNSQGLKTKLEPEKKARPVIQEWPSRKSEKSTENSGDRKNLELFFFKVDQDNPVSALLSILCNSTGAFQNMNFSDLLRINGVSII